MCVSVITGNVPIPAKMSYGVKHTKDGIHVDNHVMIVFKGLGHQEVTVGHGEHRSKHNSFSYRA